MLHFAYVPQKVKKPAWVPQFEPAFTVENKPYPTRLLAAPMTTYTLKYGKCGRKIPLIAEPIIKQTMNGINRIPDSVLFAPNTDWKRTGPKYNVPTKPIPRQTMYKYTVNTAGLHMT